jgi:hypothetical protein
VRHVAVGEAPAARQTFCRKPSGLIQLSNQSNTSKSCSTHVSIICALTLRLNFISTRRSRNSILVSFLHTPPAIFANAPSHHPTLPPNTPHPAPTPAPRTLISLPSSPPLRRWRPLSPCSPPRRLPPSPSLSHSLPFLLPKASRGTPPPVSHTSSAALPLLPVPCSAALLLLARAGRSVAFRRWPERGGAASSTSYLGATSSQWLAMEQRGGARRYGGGR